ncbi:MAG: FkbM family methyltransferase [Ignavibacteriales bacterium]|nr:FkbM family methyltransferase [Ignavibacteriales bacterium]
MFDMFQGKTTGVCVEVGANNGIDDSTTLFFENMGWKCILVEPNPSLCRQIRENRRALLFEYAASDKSDTINLYVVEGAARSDGMSTVSTEKEVHERIKSHGFVTSTVQVRTMTLDSMLVEAHINDNIDFISIDVEGHEYKVLQGFSVEKWRPFILLVEDNSNFENSTVMRYLKQFGYIRFMRTGVNDWYAHRTNKQLVNSKTRLRMIWLMLKSKTKRTLRRIPPLAKMINLIRAQGAR